VRGLYVHIPFCVRKCAYCDFYSIPGRSDAIGDYVKAVLAEACTHSGKSFQTLYIGGGTPSLLGAAHLQDLMLGLRQSFNLKGLAEASIEVNPDSATRDFLEAAKSTGINRVSVGVQSLTDSELKSVGRVHTAAQAVAAVKLAKGIGFSSVSADLIIGLPEQTWWTLSAALETLMGLDVSHLSVYCLSLEDGTPLAQDPPPELPTEDVQADLFDRVRLYLSERNFSHYEISNFALANQECLHNINYWHGGDYLGLGPAAASHLDGKRFRNKNDFDAYMKNPASQAEYDTPLTEDAKVGEEAMLRLRLLVEGINPGILTGRYSPAAIAMLVSRLNSLATRGMLKFDGAKYVIPASHVLTSNSIFREVLS
jgi:oxygen-independent coproporphyrinogen III oxidase